MLDSTGRITTWNEGAERIKGYSAEEILGVHFSIFYTPADLRTGKPARELLIAEQHGRVEEEGWRVRKDGTQFWANVVITALRDETGLLCGFGKVTRDISYRKKIEESLELQRQELAEKNAQLLVANNELESFSYSVHTTCAPHSEPSTVSVTLCWKITNANQTQRPRITCEVFALQPCAWAISLMTFLALARLSRASMRFSNLDISSIVTSIVGALRKAEPARVVELQTIEGLKATADAGLLRIALENLLGNAWKFISKKSSARIEFGQTECKGSTAFSSATMIFMRWFTNHNVYKGLHSPRCSLNIGVI